MLNALIGHTGFVGGNLCAQFEFDHFYNSANIEMIAGKSYDLVVCCGAPAEKWKINRDPRQDQENLSRLREAMSKAAACKMVLISTIDVYPEPRGVDEDTDIDLQCCHSYGKHRLELEQFVSGRFDTLVVRLPGLFGKGIKKNIIFDFLTNNRVEEIHCDSIYQFYDLDNLWRDIQIALAHGLRLVNFATEPTSVGEVARHGFGLQFMNKPNARPAQYDMKSRYASIFGGDRGYLYDKDQILDALRSFIHRQRAQLQ